MSVEQLKERFKKFAINTTYSNQLIRSSSSNGANYRAACRAKSMQDFIHNLKIVEEELDESIYFLELLDHFNPELSTLNATLRKEASELLAITVQSIKTSKTKHANHP